MNRDFNRKGEDHDDKHRGGAGTNTQYDGGTGGSGIVMIRYVAEPNGTVMILR